MGYVGAKAWEVVQEANVKATDAESKRLEAEAKEKQAEADVLFAQAEVIESQTGLEAEKNTGGGVINNAITNSGFTARTAFISAAVVGAIYFAGKAYARR